MSDKSKIEWTDATWNPVTGCLRDCPYCYAIGCVKRFQGYELNGEITTYNPYDGPAVLDKPMYTTSKFGIKRRAAFPFGFDPTLHKYRLDEPSRNRQPKNIFVGSMSDLFGDWVPDEWIEQVFDACREAPWHRYLFLTKNPKRYVQLLDDNKLLLGDNIWYGFTHTGGEMFGLPEGINRFVSIEPILEEVVASPFTWNGGIDWVILGAETGKNRKDKVIPDHRWVDNVVRYCRGSGIPVFMKNSIAPFWGGPLVEEFPWG